MQKHSTSNRVRLAGSIFATALAVFGNTATAKPLTAIGVTMGSLGNPYFVALVKGVTAEARTGGANIAVTSVSADYDLNKQFTQIDNFIAAGVNLIVINAVDPNAILPAIKRAQAAGIAVVAADVAANGADATIMTDNTLAGNQSCAFLAEKLGGKGNVIIENGPQVSSVMDRVKGCKAALAKSPNIKILSSDQDAKGSRDGGLQVMQGYLIRYSDVNGLFAINDPQAIGSELAAKQQHRNGIVITSVDGAPDIVSSLKANGLIEASATQDPYTMGRLAVKAGRQILDGHPPADPITLMPPKLITKANVDSYVGWTQH
ncbi:MAG: substrate-binding domain-containing protein [Janthinobacterium lividum]